MFLVGQGSAASLAFTGSELGPQPVHAVDTPTRQHRLTPRNISSRRMPSMTGTPHGVGAGRCNPEMDDRLAIRRKPTADPRTIRD
jgi:hypothetical protein